MKKLLVALFIVLASPLLVKVNINHPVHNSSVAFAGRTFDGGNWTYCDPCTAPAGTCQPGLEDSPCLNGSTVPVSGSDALNTGVAPTSLPLLALVISLLLARLRT